MRAFLRVAVWHLQGMGGWGDLSVAQGCQVALYEVLLGQTSEIAAEEGGIGVTIP